MYSCILIPFEGLTHIPIGEAFNELRFGESRPRVRKIFEVHSISAMKTPFASNPMDIYEQFGLQIHYDADDGLEFIEAYPPCIPNYHNIQLISRNLRDVLEDLGKTGAIVRQDSEGYFFDQLGFALYAPHDAIEAVSVFRQGYYDN